MADEKPTVEIEKPPAWAIGLKEEMVRGFQGLRADVSLVANDLSIVRDRVVILERWKVESDERATKTSERVRGASEVDLKHDALIAQLATDVAAIKDRPDTAAVVLTEVRAMADKPWAKKLGGALLPVLLLAISAIGIRLQMAVTKLEEKPQPAPVVVTVPADAGVR